MLKGIAIETKEQTDVATSAGISFLVTATLLSVAAVFDTMLIAFLVSALR